MLERKLRTQRLGTKVGRCSEPSPSAAPTQRPESAPVWKLDSCPSPTCYWCPWSCRKSGQGRGLSWYKVFWEANMIIFWEAGWREKNRELPSSSACWDFCLFRLFRKSKHHLTKLEWRLPSFSRAAVGRACWKLRHGLSKAYLILLPGPNTENGMEPSHK